MCDMHVGQEEIVVADHGFFARQGSPVHGAVFAENIIIANFQKGGLPGVFEVLGDAANAGAGEERIPCADHRRTRQGDVIVQHTAFAKVHPFANHGIRADGNAGGELRPGVDNGSGVDHVT